MYFLKKTFIVKNKLNISIILFVFLFAIIHFIKPSIIYDRDGSFKKFGVGYRNKTVIPIWIVSIILGIFSYLIVLSYIEYF